MKLKSKIITSTAVVSLLTLSAPAQDSSNLPADGSTHPSYDSSHGRGMNRLNETAKASDVIGLAVKNSQDEKLGKVEDLAVDVKSGRIVQVIISTGGFLGMGASLTAVPPGALQYDAGQKILRLDASKEKFAAAPKFDQADWAAGTESNRVSEVYGYYGQQPYFAGNREDSFKKRDLIDARAKLVQALLADPYDPEKMRQAFADIREKTGALQKHVQDAAAGALAVLSPASRKELATQ